MSEVWLSWLLRFPPFCLETGDVNISVCLVEPDLVWEDRAVVMTLTLSLPSHCSLLTSHLSLEETAEAPTDGSRLTDGGCRLGAATVLLGHSQCWPRAPLLPSPTRVSIHLWYTIRSSPCNWWQSFSPQEMWEELDWPRAKVSLLEIEPGVILLGLGPLTALTKWSSYK